MLLQLECPRRCATLDNNFLTRDTYSVAEAARLLRVSPPTLRRWLEGREGYQPVIRPEPTGSGNVTWGEFVEARFLCEYRKRRSLQRLRPVIARLREELDVAYPLATGQPFVGPGLELTLRTQQAENLPDELAIVYEIISGQLVLAPVASQFMERVQFAEEHPRWVVRIMPQGADSPVVIDPEFSFGAPTVRGIRTEAITEMVDAGESLQEVAEDYSLSAAEVRAAVTFEWQLAA